MSQWLGLSVFRSSELGWWLTSPILRVWVFSVLAGFKGSGLRNQASNYGVLAVNRHFGITGVVLPTIVVAIPSVHGIRLRA